MSKRREVINFTEGALPDKKVTEILGATFFCLDKSKTYEEFKGCIINPKGDESNSLTEDAEEAVGTVADSVSNAADSVADSTRKGRYVKKK